MTSSDILNIVLSVSILAVAVALTWFLVEIIRIVRGTRKSVEGIERSVQNVESAVSRLGDRLVESVASIGPLVQGIIKIAGALIERRRNKKESENFDE